MVEQMGQILNAVTGFGVLPLLALLPCLLALGLALAGYRRLPDLWQNTRLLVSAVSDYCHIGLTLVAVLSSLIGVLWTGENCCWMAWQQCSKRQAYRIPHNRMLLAMLAALI